LKFTLSIVTRTRSKFVLPYEVSSELKRHLVNVELTLRQH